MDKNIVLYDDEKDCCACGACMNICPKSAITMVEDDYGFVYPHINYDVCIKCGLCKKVCAFQNGQVSNNVLKSYAATSSNKEIIQKSASGGVFATIANSFLECGGAVYGCSMENTNGVLMPKHIKITSNDKLYKLQCSKYVQSDLTDCFKQIRDDLESGENVMFSGTPCQVASMYTFLENNKYDNFYTVDIICHGVPSANFFRGYIELLNRNVKGQITNFRFRDKSNGWGLQSAFDYVDHLGNNKSKLINSELSSYYKLFLNSSTYRESCYNCKYTNEHRAGDLTLGDYWGIQNKHPEYLVDNGADLDLKSGISCVLINTIQGQKLLKKYGAHLKLKETIFENIAEGNEQLNHPSFKPNVYNEIMEMYKNGNYDAVEKWFNKNLGIKKYIKILKDKLKCILKKISS